MPMKVPPLAHRSKCTPLYHIIISLLLLSSLDAFAPLVRHKTTTSLAATPSRVVDPDGPTPVEEPVVVEEIDPNDVEGLAEITDSSQLPRPIPHQEWRRGDTAGCEAPIHAEWRQQAEREIYAAVELVDGKVLDITWYLTTLLVTIDDTVMPPRDLFKDRGPVVNVIEPKLPLYYDPDDPNPAPIWDDEDDVYRVIKTEDEIKEAAERRRSSYVAIDPEEDDPDEPHCPDEGAVREPLYMNEESRIDFAHWVGDELVRREEDSMKPYLVHQAGIDTAGLSTIGKAIFGALEFYEEEWRILARHEVVLSSPNPAPDVIETQKQFDANRDCHVIVETVDPFKSNRTLKGQLVDRNSMDLLLNIKGRLVTVPLNFVRCVRLPPGRYGEEEEEEEEEEEGEVEGMLSP